MSENLRYVESIVGRHVNAVRYDERCRLSNDRLNDRPDPVRVDRVPISLVQNAAAGVVNMMYVKCPPA
jgi:hypothetical protein